MQNIQSSTYLQNECHQKLTCVTQQQYLQDVYKQLYGRIVTKNICYACQQTENKHTFFSHKTVSGGY